MKTSAEVAEAILELPPIERAQLLLRAWASIANDPGVAADPALNPEGLAPAAHRDAGLNADRDTPIDDIEFCRRTAAHE